MTKQQDELHEILSSSNSTPSEGIECLLSAARPFNLAPNTVVMEAHQTCPYIFAVKTGLLRAVFTTQQGKEFSKEFYWENDIIFGMRSLIESTPLPYSVVSESQCLVFQIPKEQYLLLVSKYSSWKDYHIQQLEQHLLHKEIKEELLLLNSNEQKVRRVYEIFPKFVQRVPATLVASYLGLTPVSLSRIKKRLGL